MSNRPFTTVQFENIYDVYKMRALVDDLERQFLSLQQELTSVAGTDHNDLPGRGVDDAHPISAITNLQEEIDRARVQRYFLGE